MCMKLFNKLMMLLVLSLVLNACGDSTPKNESANPEPPDTISNSDDSEEDLEPTPEPEQEQEPGPEPEPTPTPMPQAGNCENLGEIEEMQDVMPQEILEANEWNFALAVDPNQPGTVYLGTTFTGFWKSEDCGSSWSKVATGTNAEAINNSMTWSMVVDPVFSNILFVAAGYSNGGSWGLYKSTNGGVDWELSWPPAEPEFWSNGLQPWPFINTVTMNPNNSLHMVITFHQHCLEPYSRSDLCFAETKDGGATWNLVQGLAEWEFTDFTSYVSNSIFFIDDTTWLLLVHGDGGLVGSWVMSGMNDLDNYTAEKIPDMVGVHLQGTQFLKSSVTGSYFAPVENGLARNRNGGNAQSWEILPGTNSRGGGIVEAEGAIYYSNCFEGNTCPPSIMKTIDDGQTWTTLDNPFNANRGGPMAYDRGNGLIYVAMGDHVLRFRIK